MALYGDPQEQKRDRERRLKKTFEQPRFDHTTWEQFLQMVNSGEVKIEKSEKQLEQEANFYENMMERQEQKQKER